MANSIRVAERTGCESCEDYGLSFDLVKAEALLVTRSMSKTDSHLDDLAATIETAIIPRLLLSHGGGRSMNDLSPQRPVNVTPQTVDVFTQLVFSPDNAEAIDFIEDVVSRGLRIERVLLDLLAPSARLMGEMWTADQVSFVDVTLGLSRIQQLLRQLRNMTDGSAVSAVNKGRALLVPAPGEQHTFGLRVVEEFLLRDGWEVRSNLRATEHDILQLAAEDSYDFVGLSLSAERLLPELQSAIAKLRKCSRNRTVRVMVGGVLFSGQSEYTRLVDADAAVIDAQQAVDKANEWYAPAQMN